MNPIDNVNSLLHTTNFKIIFYFAIIFQVISFYSFSDVTVNVKHSTLLKTIYGIYQVYLNVRFKEINHVAFFRYI
jgi:hypothetical protein